MIFEAFVYASFSGLEGCRCGSMHFEDVPHRHCLLFLIGIRIMGPLIEPAQAMHETYLVPIHKWPICPISVLCEKFYPRNINHMPAVKFFACLDLDQIFLFLDGHYLRDCESHLL